MPNKLHSRLAADVVQPVWRGSYYGKCTANLLLEQLVGQRADEHVAPHHMPAAVRVLTMFVLLLSIAFPMLRVDHAGVSQSASQIPAFDACCHIFVQAE